MTANKKNDDRIKTSLAMLLTKGASQTVAVDRIMAGGRSLDRSVIEQMADEVAARFRLSDDVNKIAGNAVFYDQNAMTGILGTPVTRKMVVGNGAGQLSFSIYENGTKKTTMLLTKEQTKALSAFIPMTVAKAAVVAMTPASMALRMRAIAEQYRDLMERAVDGSNPTQAANVYVALRADLDELSESLKVLKATHDLIQHETLPKLFEDSGVTSVTTPGYRVTISQALRASIKPDEKEKAFDWLRDTGHGAAIIETVNASTLAALAQSLIRDEGKELPEQHFNVHTFNTTSVTKVAKRG